MSKHAKSPTARGDVHPHPTNASFSPPPNFLGEVPLSPNPNSPQLFTSPPLPSLTNTSRLASSTAPTQLVRCGTIPASPQLITNDSEVCTRFLLYNAAGRLIGARELTDPWGVLVSEHITLNCTYGHRTVRVGREKGCDAVVREPLVSTTHFTISLELEPLDPQDNDFGLSAEGRDAGAGVPRQRRPLRNYNATAVTGTNNTNTASTNTNRTFENEETMYETVAEVSSPTSVASLSPRDAGLPAWRMRRVLLTDCSANGTYINDELVGRGRYRELHSGNDISIVRVPEATSSLDNRSASAAVTATASYTAVRNSGSNDDDDDVNEEDIHMSSEQESRVREQRLIRQSKRTLRELKRQHPTAPAASAVTTTQQQQLRRRRARNDADDGRDDKDADEAEGDLSSSSHNVDTEELDKTQMFTALLSTLSTTSKYTYLERFCFHLYNTEESSPHGIEAVTLALQSSSTVSLEDERQREDEDARVREGGQKTHKGARTSGQLEAVLPTPLSPVSMHDASLERGMPFSANSSHVLHQRSVRFTDPSEVKEETKHADGSANSLAPPANDRFSQDMDASAAPSASSASAAVTTTLPSSIKATNRIGALITPAATGAPRSLTARQKQVVSTLVTPYSLLRSRPSIRTSFIAPITLSEREGSTASSIGASPHAMSSPTATFAPSTAATCFHENLSISSAVQRRAAAKQRGDTRRVQSNRPLASSSSSNIQNNNAHNSDVGALGGLLKDVPADIPIRYAVLPLRHLQWGGRIGSGASGDVYMGIDVSTATAVAIKVLKGGSLFPPTNDAKAVSPPAAVTASTRAVGGHGGRVPPVGQSLVIRPVEDTLLSLSDVSFGNSPPTSRSSSQRSVSVSTAPAASVSTPTLCATSKGSPFGHSELAEVGDEEARTTMSVNNTDIQKTEMTESLSRVGQSAHHNEEGDLVSASPSVASTPHTPASSTSTTTPTEHGRHLSTETVSAATADVNADTAANSGIGSFTVTLSQRQQRAVQQRQQRGGAPQAPPRTSAPPIIRKHFREIVFLTTLQHHRIVRFLGFQFSGDGRLCLLMEYVAGGTLQTLIRNFGAFEENVIRLYTLQILEGLEYLVRKGVVHGDLKSANILVSEQGNVKLTDFGTSRFVRDCATDDNATMTRKGASAASERRSCGSTGHCTSAFVQHSPKQHQQRSSNCGSRDHDVLQHLEDTTETTHKHSVPSLQQQQQQQPQLHTEEAEIENVKRSSSSNSDTDGEADYDEYIFSEENSDEDQNDDPSQGRVLCGTPLYMSPELIRTQEPSFASDIWALGCVVYEMATGGVLPWRPIHNSSASAVILYIGQRRTASEAPPFDDVYAERERLNEAARHRSSGDSSNGADGTIVYERDDEGGVEEEGEDGGGVRVHGGASTPSPMLIDFLQCTLNINAVERPSAAELLQHPFIRGENSIAALEKWHATVAAKRRALLAKAAQKQLEASCGFKSREGSGGDDESQNEDEENPGHVEGGEKQKTPPPGNEMRTTTGSLFDPNVIISTGSGGSTKNKSDSIQTSIRSAWKAVTPPRTGTPLHVEEVVNVDSDGNANTSATVVDCIVHSPPMAARVIDGETRNSRRSSSSMPSPQPTIITALPQPISSIVVKAPVSLPPPRNTIEAVNWNTAPNSLLLGDSWEDIKPFSSTPVAPTQQQQFSPAEHGSQQLSPALIAQPQSPQAGFGSAINSKRQINTTGATPSVLGEGNPESQTIINEPPRPVDATGQQTGYWFQVGQRECARLPTGTNTSSHIPSLPLISTSCTQLSHDSYISGSAPAPSMSLSFPSSTALAPFKVPLPRSQVQATSEGKQRQLQQSYRFSGSTSKPSGTYTRSNVAQHRLFLRESEQARLSASLATSQLQSQPSSHQTRGRPRTEGPLPTYDDATHYPPQHMQQQQQQLGPVLGNSQGYSYHNPQLSTQTMEMHVPIKFATQPTSNGSGRYGQHGSKSHNSKRKARTNALNNGLQMAGGEGAAQPRDIPPAVHSPRGGSTPRPGPVLGNNNNSNSITGENGGYALQSHQQSTFMPPQRQSACWPGELTLAMDSMTLSSPRTGGQSASAYTGVVPSMSQQPPSQQQQRLQGHASSGYNSGSSMTVSNPAPHLDYALCNTSAAVLGDGNSRPRRLMVRRGRGGRRTSYGRRQSAAVIARISHTGNGASAVLNSNTGSGEGGGDMPISTPRRSSIGRLRQRRRDSSRHDSQCSAFAKAAGMDFKSVLYPQAVTNNDTSAVLPSPPPPLPQQPAEQPKSQSGRKDDQRQAAGQKESTDKAYAATSSGQKRRKGVDKRRVASRSRSSLRARKDSKREPHEPSKKGK